MLLSLWRDVSTLAVPWEKTRLGMPHSPLIGAGPDFMEMSIEHQS